MAKLISTKSNRASKSVSLAIVGVVEFNSECVAEIAEEAAEPLSEYLLPHPALGYYVEGLPTNIEGIDYLGKEDEGSDEVPEESAGDVTAGVDTSEIPAEESEEAATEEEIPAEEVPETESEGESVDDILSGMDADGMKEFCEESGFPKDEWNRKTSEKSLKKYIKEKLA